MRIVFLGTGDIGLPSLDALLASPEHEVAAVVTQPDKPVGRKQVLTPPQVKVQALAAGVPVMQPERIRHAVDELAALRAEVFVVIAYGQLLPRAVLNLPSKGCLNVHASLLPRHRGASPIQAAIREGDAESGVTIMWMDEGLDTGDMLLKSVLPIHPDDTGGSLHDRLAQAAPAALLQALSQVAAGTAPHLKQDDSLATHSRKLERAHGRLDWSQDADTLARLVRAYQPWPGTFCILPATESSPQAQLKVHAARIVSGAHACPAAGTVLESSSRLLVSCGQGVLELLEVQMEGRKRMSAREFLQGCTLPPGTILA